MNRDKAVHKVTRLMRVIMFVLVTIGVASAIRRILALDGIIPAPVNLKGGTPSDASFGKHPLLTLMHILPGILFMMLGLG